MAKELIIPHPTITNNPRTSMTGPAVAGAVSIPVENGLAFGTGQFIIVRNYGNKQAEIVRISNGSPTASALPLNASNPLQFDQPSGMQVAYIPYNQVAIEYSSDFDTLFNSGDYDSIADAAAAATWAALTTINITPSNPDGTFYFDSAVGTSRAYRTRFYNSASNVYSGYSDAVLSTGYEEFSAQSMIDRAMEEMSVSIGNKITQEYMYNSILNCQRYVQRPRKRWSFNQAYQSTIDEITAGKNEYRLPSLIDISSTKRAMLHMWINDGSELDYVDKNEFNYLMREIHTSTLGGSLTSASGTITLADTSDFADSGNFIVFTGATRDEIEYTANNRTTNTLTLASPNGATTTHAVGTQVWQNARFGTPTRYTIFGGKIYFDTVPDEQLHQRTIKGDYYRKVIPINSPNDYILFPDPLIVVDYLCMSIASRLEKEQEVIKYKSYVDDALGRMVTNETDEQKRMFKQFVPYVNAPISSRGRFGGRRRYSGE